MMLKKKLLKPKFSENGLIQINYKRKGKYDSTFSEEEESQEKSDSYEREKKFKLEDNSIDEDSFSKEKEYNNENLGKKKINDNQSKLLNRKRVNGNLMRKKFHKSERKHNNKKKINEQVPNSNTLSELNSFYNELDKLISKFSFNEVISIILKLINGIPQDFRDNNELFKKINSINKKIDNKNSLTLMCLSILTSKSCLDSNNNGGKKIEKRNKTFEKKSINKNDYRDNEKRQAIENGRISIKKEISKSNKLEFIKGFRCNLKKLVFGNHYFNCCSEIYGFRPKTSKYINTVTCYCLERESRKCEAKCKVKVNSNKVHLIGVHNHLSGISTFYFYKKYYFLKDIDWTHIQIIREVDKKKVFLQS